MFCGARESLARYRPILIVEASGFYLRRLGASVAELYDELSRHGYRVHHIGKLGLVKPEPNSDNQTNWVALPESMAGEATRVPSLTHHLRIDAMSARAQSLDSARAAYDLTRGRNPGRGRNRCWFIPSRSRGEEGCLGRPVGRDRLSPGSMPAGPIHLRQSQAEPRVCGPAGPYWAACIRGRLG